MLTSLEFLTPGQKWPPTSELDRLDMYAKNKQLFEGDHVSVYEDDFKRIERVIGNFGDVISYPIILNFQKVMSLKVADLLVGEPPKFACSQQDKLDEIVKDSDLINTAYMEAIDISRYGDGLMYVRSKDGKGFIDLTQPAIWFPVVNPDNVREIVYHVLAWTYEEGVGDQKTKYLKCQIHSPGSYEQRVYMITGEVLDKMMESNVFPTGLDDFAIVPAPNILTSDRVTGIDDYTDIDSIISELMIRLGQVSRILDKHASPTMTGPLGALERDPVSGEWHFKSGNYIPAEKEDMKPEYITWDGQLQASFNQIDKLSNLLYAISEMGSAVFGDVKGAIPSGSALKRLMVSPLAKVNRIRMRFDHALKKAIKLCGQISGVDFSDVTITWQDGLPGDPMEEAQILSLRIPGVSTMSIKTALQRFDGMTEASAEDEAGQIQDDTEQNRPTLITGTEPMANA